jgi:putative flippase GtrA
VKTRVVAAPAPLIWDRCARAIRQRHNWIQLAKFSAVGGSGVVVNLAVYETLQRAAGIHYLPAATCSFLVAVTSNYVWHRVWTFRGHRGGVADQGSRFLVVSLLALGLNLLLLHGFVAAGMPKLGAQALAIFLVMPANFLGNRLWSFRHR